MILAHGVGNRQDLPLPLGYAVVGAAVALGVSFLALAVLWREPRLRGERAGWPLPAPVARALDAPAFRWLLRLLGLALTGYALVGALFGPDLAINPTAGVVYVLFWVGIVPASVLLGPVWRLLNPLRTVHLLLVAALRGDPRQGLLRLPAWIGYWPAAAGLFAFVWLELVPPDRATLPVLRTWFGLYAGVHLIAAAVFGSRWFDRGDAFEVWSDLAGRFSVLGRRLDGRLVLRSPLDGLASLRPHPGLVAVIAVVLGSTLFDSMSSAPFWFRFTQRSPVGIEPTDTLGLVGLVLVVGLAFTAASLLAGSLGHADRRALPGEFAHTLVPIAVGYVVAHYYSLFVLVGQSTVIQLSDPLVTGTDNWLGTAQRGVDSSWVTPTAVAVLQVLAIVAGHVIGVVLAHDRGIRLFPRAQALGGQLPLLALMVGYTVCGLLILFAA